MNAPSWHTCLQTLVLLSIGGFALVIMSGLWKVLLLLIIAAALFVFWPRNPTRG